MSALGYWRTFRLTLMSALPPKADICSAQTYVRFVPKADIQPAGFSRSVASGGALNPQVDFAAKRAEIDRPGEKCFSAVL
jgi:hypothetical protein